MGILSSAAGIAGTNVGTAIAKLVLDATDFSTKLNKTAKDVEGFGNKFRTSLDSISSAMSSIGSSMTRNFTIPIATALGAATTKYTNFSGTLQEAGTIMNATSTEMKLLSDEAYRAASKSIFTTSDAAQAYKYMAMAGWGATESTAALSSIMSLAAISGEDLGTVSDIVTDDLTAFGLSADDASHFANVLAEVSMDANTNVGLMGEAMKYAGPLAGTLGYSIEDVSAAMGIMASQSIKGSTAGTTLRQALVSMINPSKDAMGAMKNLGLVTQETNRVYNDEKISSAQAKVEKATNKLEKAQISYNDAVAKYGENSSQAQEALLSVENATIDLEQAQEKLNKELEGSLEEGAIYNELMFDSTGKAKPFREVLVQLREAFSGLSEEEQSSAAATIFGQRAMSGMLAIMNATDEEFEEFIGNLDNARDAEEVAYNMLDSLKGSFEKFKSSLDVFLTRLGEAFAPVIERILESLTNLLDRLNQLSDEELRHIATIAAIVAAIGPALLILAKIITAISTITGAVSKAISLISNLASVGSNAIGLVSKLASSLGGIMSSVGSVISSVVSSVGSALSTIGGFIASHIATISGIGAVIGGAILAIKNFVDMWKEGWSAIKTILEALGLAIAAIGAVILGAPATVAAVIAGIIFVVSQLAVVIHDNWDAIVGWTKDTIDSIVEFFKRGSKSIKEKIDDLKKNITDFFSNIAKDIKSFFGDAIKRIKTFFEDAKNNVVSFFSNAYKKVTTFFSDTIDKIIEFFSNIIKKIIEYFEKILKNIKEFFTNVKDKAKEFFGNAADKIKSFFSNTIKNVLEWMKEILKNIKDKFKEIVDNIKSFGSDFKEAAKELLSLLWDGFKEIWGSIQGWFEEKFGWVLDIVDNIKSAVSSVAGAISGVWDGTHANGLDYVPFNGYVAQLHKGERVLTKQENEEYSSGNIRSGGGDTFNFYNTKPDPYEYARQMKRAKKELASI